MSVTHATAVRNAIADLIDDRVNTGSADAGGDLLIRDDTTTLVEIEFDDPAFGAASVGVITLAGVPLTGVAGASGTADNFQIRSRDNTVIFSGSVTVTSGGGDIEVDNTSINTSQNVSLASLTYTAPP